MYIYIYIYMVVWAMALRSGLHLLVFSRNEWMEKKVETHVVLGNPVTLRITDAYSCGSAAFAWLSIDV